MAKHEAVTFLDSSGNTISNDPVYLAQQTLSQAGVGGREDFDIPGPYDELTGDQLKAEVKKRGISARGFRKASQFREALEAWDEENEPEDESDADDESDDDEDSGDSDDDQE